MTDASWTIGWHDVLGSTNDHARGLARRGAADRTVVAARTQEQGRGRGENRWASPEGGLYCSLIVRDVPRPLVPLLALVAGEALARTLTALRVRLPFWLKWPNDLLVAPEGEGEPAGKAAGILVETVSRGDRLEHAVVGLGVNLHTDEADLPSGMDPPAVSLRTFQEDVPDRELFLDVFLGAFERVLREFAGAPDRLAAAVNRRLAWGGTRVVARLVSGGSVEGILLGLAPSGALRLDTVRGERVLEAWDVASLDRAS